MENETGTEIIIINQENFDLIADLIINCIRDSKEGKECKLNIVGCSIDLNNSIKEKFCQAMRYLREGEELEGEKSELKDLWEKFSDDILTLPAEEAKQKYLEKFAEYVTFNVEPIPNPDLHNNVGHTI